MRSRLPTLTLALAALGTPMAGAAPAPPKAKGGTEATGQIYTCIDAQGNRLSSDRPIPECAARDQRLLNRDGTTRAVVPPLQSPEERARAEAIKRQADQLRLAREAEARRDRALLARYPDQDTHDEARAKALEQALRQAENARRRLQELENDGQALTRDREALGGRAVPASLRARIAANEGAVEAQQTILRDQEAEQERLNRQFDAELARLRALWAGAAPGRMGPLPVPMPSSVRASSAP
jgi:hypothetical protein